MKIRINTSSDKRLTFFIATTVIALLLNNLTHNLPFSETLDSIINIVLKSVVGFVFITQILIIFNRFNKHLFIFTSSVVFVITANIVFFPELLPYFINNTLKFCTFCFPAYLVLYSIRDFDLLRTYLTKVSYFISAIMLLFLIAVLAGLIDFSHYDMALGYNCLFPTMILFWDFTRNKKITTLVSILIMILSILVLGSRGPLIGIFSFGLFFWIRSLIQKHKYGQIASITIIILLFALMHKTLLIYLYGFLQNFGIHSRTLSLMTSQTIHMSGRDEIYTTLIRLIENDPFTIRGINAEWDLFNAYAHNIILELLYQFGVVLGGIFLLYIFVKALRTISFKELDSPKVFSIILMFASLPQLFVSSSLWTNQMFWMWMAVSSKITILDESKCLDQKINKNQPQGVKNGKNFS